MRIPRGAIALLALMCAGAASLAGGVPTTPLRNVEIVDKHGLTTKLYGFYRLSGEDLFRGFLGEAEIEVPFEKAREFRMTAPSHPTGRPGVAITLRSGETVKANFDRREEEAVFSGYSDFGRVTIFFRDIRRLTILGRTKRTDLPKYGPSAAGYDVKLTDRTGVATELVEFRRTTNENVIPAVRGSASIMIPLRVVKRIEFTRATGSATKRGTAILRNGSKVDFGLPTYVEEVQYRGHAEFGLLRIRLGKIKSIEVHRATPVLRDLDPLDAARGREPGAPKEGGRPR